MHAYFTRPAGWACREDSPNLLNHSHPNLLSLGERGAPLARRAANRVIRRRPSCGERMRKAGDGGGVGAQLGESHDAFTKTAAQPW